MSKARRVASNTLYQVIGRAGVTLVSLLSVTITTRYLGTTSYGEFTTAVVYLSFFGILADWGIYTVAVREIARLPDEAARIVGSITYFRLIFSFVVMLIAAGVAVALPYSATTKAAIFVASASLPLNSLTQSFSGFFQANLQMKYVVLSEVLSRIAGLVLLLGAIFLDAGVVGVIATSVLASLVASVLSLYWMLRFVKPSTRVDLPYAWKLFIAAVPFGLAAVIQTIYFKIDTIILSLTRGATEVGVYGVAYRIIEMILTLPGFFVLSIFPIVSGYIATQDSRLTEVIQRSIDVLLMSALLVTVLIALVAKPVIVLISGDQFVEAALPLQVLMIGVAVSFLNVFLGYLLVAYDQQRKLLGLGIFTLVLNIALNLYAIPRFGYMGAAWTTVASEAAVILLALVLVKRVYSWLPSFRVLPKALIAVIVATGPTLLILRLSLPELVTVVGATTVFVSVYTCLLYALKAISVEEIRQMLRKPGSPGP